MLSPSLRQMRVLVLAPHFDDAPLSLGQAFLDGELRGHRISVGVLFSRSNWTRFMHPTRKRWPIVTAIRLAEETVTALRFRYRFRLGGVEEAILRTGDSNPERLLTRVDTFSDYSVVDELISTISTWAESADVVIAPLSVGNHLDHQLTTEAARRVSESGVQVAYYEDRPYTAWLGDDEVARIAALVDDRLVRRAVSGPITSAKHRRLFYPSQLSEDFTSAIADDEAQAKCEHVWVLPDAPWPPQFSGHSV